MRTGRFSIGRRLNRTLVLQLRLASVIAVLIALGALWIVGRVPNRQWNVTRQQSVRTFNGPDGSTSYSLCTVELDDQGVLWDGSQLSWALDHLNSEIARSDNGAIVFLFVHGWKQDAGWREGAKGRLAEFRDELEGIAASAATLYDGKKPPPVVGVYVGWRGRSFSLPFLENLTFWNRRVAATRASSIDLLEILLKVAAVTRHDEPTKLVLMGYSLGGAILERTLAPALASAALADPTVNRTIPVDFDLVVLANPASSALEADRLIHFFDRNRVRLVTVEPDGTVAPARGPLIASVNSEADMVNRVFYPVGMWFNSFFLRYREDHAEGMPNQRRLGTRAAGHEQSLISHDARVTEDRSVVLTPRAGHSHGAPYWIIRVPQEISSEHSDVTNPLFARLMIDLMERNRVFDSGVEVGLQVDSEVE